MAHSIHSGSRMAGGTSGGGNSIFLGDYDLKKLVIGGLDFIFGGRLLRRFGRRITYSR